MAMATTRMAMAGREMADHEFAYQLQMEEAMAASLHANLAAVPFHIAETDAIQHKRDVGEGGGAESGPDRAREDAEAGVELEAEVEVEREDDGGGLVWNSEQEYDIEVRAVKTPEGHVGIGYTLTDPRRKGRVVWQRSRYAGQGLSWHVAEYSGLLEAMDVADRLGLRLVSVRVSSRVVSDQVRLLILV